jgi:hypothetical protein
VDGICASQGTTTPAMTSIGADCAAYSVVMGPHLRSAPMTSAVGMDDMSVARSAAWLRGYSPRLSVPIGLRSADHAPMIGRAFGEVRRDAFHHELIRSDLLAAGIG